MAGQTFRERAEVALHCAAPLIRRDCTANSLSRRARCLTPIYIRLYIHITIHTSTSHNWRSTADISHPSSHQHTATTCNLSHVNQQQQHCPRPHTCISCTHLPRTSLSPTMARRLPFSSRLHPHCSQCYGSTISISTSTGLLTAVTMRSKHATSSSASPAASAARSPLYCGCVGCWM